MIKPIAAYLFTVEAVVIKTPYSQRDFKNLVDLFNDIHNGHMKIKIVNTKALKIERKNCEAKKTTPSIR